MKNVLASQQYFKKKSDLTKTPNLSKVMGKVKLKEIRKSSNFSAEPLYSPINSIGKSLE